MSVVDGTIGAMGSADLTGEQADRVCAHIDRETRYLQRMIEQMRKLRWAEDDPLWEPTLQALYAMAHLRSRAQGAGVADRTRTNQKPPSAMR